MKINSIGLRSMGISPWPALCGAECFALEKKLGYESVMLRLRNEINEI